MSLLIVGSEATAPNNSGWARMTAASARQSPPSAIVTARFSTVSPGSCTDRAGRHGLNACESSLASPLTWADSSNSAAPADEINDSPPDSTPTPPQRLGFTYGVPFSYPEIGPSTSPLDLRQAHFPLLDRHFRESLAEQSHHHRLNHVGSGAGAVADLGGRPQSHVSRRVSRSAVLLRFPGQGAPFPVPARRTVRAVLPHTAHRGRSPPTFDVRRQALKGLGA